MSAVKNSVRRVQPLRSSYDWFKIVDELGIIGNHKYDVRCAQRFL